MGVRSTRTQEIGERHEEHLHLRRHAVDHADAAVDGILVQLPLPSQIAADGGSDKVLRELVVKEIEEDAKTYGDPRRTLIEAADSLSL